MYNNYIKRIPNIILNASTSVILSLINNYKLPEKLECQTFRNKANIYMHLTNSIEDGLTNEPNDINIDKSDKKFYP
jgi:hypothetical protein